MAKQGTRAEVNTFVRGLITEASPLNFPANASLDEVNFELRRDGTRRRRLGMKTEPSASFVASPAPTQATGTFVWEGVNGDFNVNYLVVQVGNVLQFYNLSASVLTTAYLGTATLEFSASERYSFASVNGNLVVAGGGGFIHTIKYSGGFTVAKRWLKVRDVWGVQEGDATTEADTAFQPATLTVSHQYNLQNQSWGIPRKDKAGTLVDPVAYYKYDLGKYPSNMETVWNGLQYQPIEIDKTETPGGVLSSTIAEAVSVGGTTSTTTVDPATGKYTTVTNVDPSTTNPSSTTTTTYNPPTVNKEYKDPYERMFNNLYIDRLGADLKATKGYYIIELLNRGASRQAATVKNNVKFAQIPVCSGFKGDYNTKGASVVCEFSGRVFYSGFDGVVVDGDSRSPSLTDYVVFSQLVQSDTEIDKCYQEGDPTSRDSSDLVDTDGGFVRISGAKKIVAMHTLGSKLVVFASNGVWAISGGADSGFTATNHSVDKLSSFGCASPTSVVNEGSNLLYWGDNAIYAITGNEMGDLNVEDLTAASIQTLYNGVSDTAKQNSQGTYDLLNKKVRWVYREGTLFTSTSQTYELVLDMVLKAFYVNVIGKVANNSYEIGGVFYKDNADIPVTYLTFVNNYVTFSTYSDTSFSDWKEYDGVGVDAKAYLLTGALTAGDSAIPKQTPYVTVHMLRTETGTDSDGVPLNQSSCMMHGRWEWATSVDSHKISGMHEVYKYRMPLFAQPGSTYDNGFEVVTSKNKVRGRGKALSLYFETSPKKDCILLGWSITLNGNGIT